MTSALRLGTALSALAISALVTGCAVGKHKPTSIAGKAGASNVGLATRALAALGANDYASAVSLAEMAVENTPGDANFRTLLGNAYFASGRFASAEAAYRDSLALNGAEPQVVLKLALTQIAQGRDAAAMGALQSARDSLEPADYGLAVALAGYPDDAVAVLGHAARAPGADSRVRQNLALAYALAGDWGMARTVAAQDLPPEQVQARVEQWMVMAKPTHAYDQVAAVTGITPAADPGQPARLALVKAPTAPRLAEAAPQPQIVAPQPQPQAVLPPPLPMPVAEAEPMPVLQVQAIAPPPPPLPPASVSAALIQPKVDAIAPLPTSFDAPPPARKYLASVKPVKPVKSVRRAPEPPRVDARSNSVVQLGAYSSADRIAAAWDQLSRRYPSLNRYRPVSARFDGPKGTFYRLAVKGFASNGEAQDLCEALQQKGKNCFVRRVAGDTPVQLASR